MRASSWTIVTLELRSEADIVLVRQRARQVAALLGLDALRQTRIATAVSEIARNAVVHAGGGRAQLMLTSAATGPSFVVRIADRGTGIPAVIVPGASVRGGGIGLTTASRLSDAFDIATGADGSVVSIGTRLSGAMAAPAATASEIADALARRQPESLLEELHNQNQEILRVLEDLMNRQEELVRLNEELEETNRGVLALHQELTRELEETNRGVVALYGELDERTDELRRTNSLKDQFISYLSHEFRTPVHSVIALSRILLSPTASPLTAEQTTQVTLIQKSTSALLELIDDLLDLAKISAGRLSVVPEAFMAADLFGALRGMMRPLVPEAVTLTFVDPAAVPPLYADHGKLSQILRNLISNALKFTHHGEVRVSARAEGTSSVVFTVSDTGIGIAPEDQRRIFQDYEQVHGAFQRRAKGTGLGLPLSQRLAELLGGHITLESEPGVGSTFHVMIPLRYRGEPAKAPPQGPTGASSGEPDILIIDDDPAARYVLRHLLESLGCTVREAESGEDGLRQARKIPPGAIFVDLVMPGMDGFELLQRLQADPVVGNVPVIIRTGKRLSDEERTQLLARAADILTKDDSADDRERAALRVAAALGRLGIRTTASGRSAH